jgi:Putative silver efflux pump
MDFGIIVDGAVIVVENIVRHLSQLRGAPDSDLRRTTILNATVQVGRPTFFSMLIIILANLPIFTLQRQEGRIFAPMAYTITAALIGSLLFSLTLVPLLCFVLLKKIPGEENALVHACQTHLSRRVAGGARAAACRHHLRDARPCLEPRRGHTAGQ